MPPSAPAQDAVISGLKAAASEAKLTAPLEASTVRPTDHGPGQFFACLKGTVLPSPSAKVAADDTAAKRLFFIGHHLCRVLSRELSILPCSSTTTITREPGNR